MPTSLLLKIGIQSAISFWSNCCLKSISKTLEIVRNSYLANSFLYFSSAAANCCSFLDCSIPLTGSLLVSKRPIWARIDAWSQYMCSCAILLPTNFITTTCGSSTYWQVSNKGKEFFENSGTDTFLTTGAFTKVLEYLIGIAQFDGVKQDLQVRIAGCTKEEPYTIYYDLTNPKCEVVKITPDGWKIGRS
jgi:hypothetical protein